MLKETLESYIKNKQGYIYSYEFGRTWDKQVEGFENLKASSMFKPVFYDSMLSIFKDNLSEILESGILSKEAKGEVINYLLSLNNFLEQK